MRYLFEPPAPPHLTIVGREEVFPVRRVYCVGRNYAAHAVEMGHDPDREPPFFFQKNPDNLSLGGEFPYPSATSDLHHEIEMVVALKSGGTDISVESALDHVFGYGVGLDMTRRDLQGEAKKMGPALGGRQSVREVGAVRAADAGRKHWPPVQRRGRADRQRQGAPGRRP